MAAASAAGGGAYIGAAPMAIATQIPPSALNGIASPGVVPSAQGPLDSDKLFSKPGIIFTNLRCYLTVKYANHY